MITFGEGAGCGDQHARAGDAALELADLGNWRVSEAPAGFDQNDGLVTPDDLVRRYPRCYHLASAGALPSIQRLGLLSTSRLLEEWEVPAEKRHRLTTRLRHQPERVIHPAHGVADIRDQHTMNESMLRRSLIDMTVEEWLIQLNSHVFFAATARRLEALYRAYSVVPRLVLTVDTSLLLKQHGDSVRLSHLNTGAVRHVGHERGTKTFLPVEEFVHERAGWVAEIAVTDCVQITPGLLEQAEIWHPDGRRERVP